MVINKMASSVSGSTQLAYVSVPIYKVDRVKILVHDCIIFLLPATLTVKHENVTVKNFKCLMSHVMTLH